MGWITLPPHANRDSRRYAGSGFPSLQAAADCWTKFTINGEVAYLHQAAHEYERMLDRPFLQSLTTGTKTSVLEFLDQPLVWKAFLVDYVLSEEDGEGINISFLTHTRQSIFPDWALDFVRRLRSEREDAFTFLLDSLNFAPRNDKATLLTELGLGLCQLYLTTGCGATLDRAVRAGNKAVVAAARDSTEYFQNLNNMGMLSYVRFNRDGVINDLNRAIDCWQEALRSTDWPNQFPREAIAYLNNLSVGYGVRYERLGNNADFKAAETYLDVAIGRGSVNDFGMAALRCNRASISCENFRQTQNAAELDRAIRELRGLIYERQLRIDQAGQAQRTLMQCNLGEFLLQRFKFRCSEREGDLLRHRADLDDAIIVLSDAINDLRGDSYMKVLALGNMANGLHLRASAFGSREDENSAAAYARDSCELGLRLDPHVTQLVGHEWLEWAVNRNYWQDAKEAARFALEASSILVAAQADRERKVVRLKQAQGLTALAAYACCRADDARTAVQLLEFGQARLMGEKLEVNRRNLEGLPETLRTRYRSVLNKWSIAYEPGNTVMVMSRSHLSRDAVQQELMAVISEIRRLPGYENFKKPLTLDHVQALATHTRPITYIAVTKYGSVTVILWPDRTEAFCGSFDSARLEALLHHAPCNYLHNLHHEPEALPHSLLMLHTALGELMSPLADRLRAGEAHGVTIVPAGLLGLLPLHCARYDREDEPPDFCFLDEFEVSFTPSVQALKEAAANDASRANASWRLTGVGNPASGTALELAAAELLSVSELTNTGPENTAYENDATKARFLANTVGATHVHLACHGSFSPTEPLDAHMQFADGRLTLREILDSPEPFSAVRMAVLSACETAVIDAAHLPDESLSMAAGLLQAGVPAIVGTLWSVHEESTALLMVRFYELMLQGVPPCVALQSAQIWLRDATHRDIDEFLAAHPHLRSCFDRRAGTRSTAHPRPYAHPVYWAAFTYWGQALVAFDA